MTTRSSDLSRPLKVGDLALEVKDLRLEKEDPTDPGEAHAFVGERDNPLDVADFLARVASLAAVGARGLNYLFGIEAPEKCRLHIQYSGDLADRVKRRKIVVERKRRHLSSPFIRMLHVPGVQRGPS
jgi:hypothetical protein